MTRLPSSNSVSVPVELGVRDAKHDAEMLPGRRGCSDIPIFGGEFEENEALAVKSQRRRNAGVDGRSTPGFASGVGCWTVGRSGEGVEPLDTGSAGVATDDRRPVRQRQHAVCGGQLCEVIRHQCGMVGVRVGEATNPGPVGPVDEELLDCLQRDLSRVPRRVRRRVMDSDSDVPLLRADPSEAQDRRDVIEGHVASTQPASLGLEAISNQSTVPGRVESQQPASTVPASSGMVRAIQRGRNPERDSVRSMRLRNRFSPLANYEQDGGEAIAREFFDLTRDDSLGEVEASRQSGVPSSVRVTPRMGEMVARVPPVESGRSMRMPEQPRRRRRLVLVSGRERESDTESIENVANTSDEDGLSEGDPQGAAVEPSAVEDPVELDLRPSQFTAGFRVLEGVSLVEIFHRRACVMRSVPIIVRGAYRMAMRIALQEVVTGRVQNSEARVSRGWKLFTLLPRLLLHRPPRGGLVPKRQLEERFRLFQQGEWGELLARSSSVDAQAHQLSSRRRRRQQQDNEERRCDRARSLVHMGELSAARRALEAAPVAPGTMATLRMLTDPERRPPVAREELCQEVADAIPDRAFDLDPAEFLVCLRTARRGAAAGPSGMTADHMFPILENERDSMLLVEVVSSLATGNVPTEIIDAIRLGRITALQKPDGGVRGIVVGDIVRRLVARTIAKQISKQVERATAPFQYALSTKAGCECIAHILQTLTDLDGNATIVSIDGVGAYDLISRNAMLRGLLRMENGDQIIPFVRCFYGRPSTYLWEDEVGDTQEIPQGEGGEQGDPLMPLLFSLGQHSALEAVQRRLQGNEKVFAYLDDVVVVCSPGRVVEVEAILRQELRRQAHIDVHQGKTQVWNRFGVTPRGIEELVRVARLEKPDAIVWKGDPSLPRTLQGIRVLGAPIGSPEYVADQLEKKSDKQETLFTRIPRVQDTQACWLLLLMCASTRANFWLRMVTPEQTLQFAERHDAAVWECLRAILGTPQAPETDEDHGEFPSFHGSDLGSHQRLRARVASVRVVQLGVSCMIRTTLQMMGRQFDVGSWAPPRRHRPRPSSMFPGRKELRASAEQDRKRWTHPSWREMSESPPLAVSRSRN